MPERLPAWTKEVTFMRRDIDNVRARMLGDKDDDASATRVNCNLWWVVSFASSVRTRELQVVITPVFTSRMEPQPRPGMWAPYVVALDTHGLSAREWLAAYTF